MEGTHVGLHTVLELVAGASLDPVHDACYSCPAQEKLLEAVGDCLGILSIPLDLAELSRFACKHLEWACHLRTEVVGMVAEAAAAAVEHLAGVWLAVEVGVMAHGDGV